MARLGLWAHRGRRGVNPERLDPFAGAARAHNQSASSGRLEKQPPGGGGPMSAGKILSGSSRWISGSVGGCSMVCLPNSRMRKNRRSPKPPDASLTADLAVVHGAFATNLRALGYAEGTISSYRRALVHIAEGLAKRGLCLGKLERTHVPQIVRGRANVHRIDRQAALHRWLKFLGRYAVCPPVGWSCWAEDFSRFLSVDRGLAETTCRKNEVHARTFMSWRFGSGPARWSQVKPADLHRFSIHCAQGVRLSFTNQKLSCLRQFLRFVELRGACAPRLAKAVPAVANFGQPVCRKFLCKRQQIRLLASFPRHVAVGRRDYAITLCLIELGLRAIEAAQLRLGDIDWGHLRLMVMPVKNGRRARELPLPPRVASALRAYIENGRPPSESDQLFLRHHNFAGRPISRGIVSHALRNAFQRAGLPMHLAGTHTLRHSFATRLYAHGANLKQIADLLGHQDIATATVYTHTDISGLRRLALHWPLRQ